MPDDEQMLNQPQIAAYLGVGVQAVKKWRGHTRKALRKAGQLDSPAPMVPLPRNALPVPDNQAEHVRDSAVDPRWKVSTIDKWIDRTGRRHDVTGEFCPAVPSGRKPDAGRPARQRRRAASSAGRPASSPDAPAPATAAA